MHGLPEHAVDPDRDLAIVVECGVVCRFSLLRSRPRLRHLGAIGQPSRQHLVGDHAEREQIGARRAAFPQEVFGRGVLHGARNGVVVGGPFRLRDPGDPCRAEVDDLHRPGPVDHDVLGPQILMQHFHAVEGAQAPRDLLDDAPHGLQVRLRIVDHPLAQGLPVDEFRDDIEIVALSRLQAGLEHMGAVDAPGDPLFHHEPLQVGRVAAQVDRWDLDDDDIVVLGIDGEVDVAATAAVDLADDPVALENRPRFQKRRRRQVGRLSKISPASPSGNSSTLTIWTVRLSGLP